MSFKETYHIDAKQAEQALRGLVGDQDRLAKATEESTKKLTAEDKAARRLAEAADPMKRFNRQLEEAAVLVGKGKLSFDDASTAVGRYADRLGGAGRVQEATFGQRAISQLAGYAAGFVSLQSAVSVIKSLFTTMKEEANSAFERVKASMDAIGELQQIDDAKGNEEFVKKLRRMGVVADASTGARLATNLDQAGFNQSEQDFIANLIRERYLNANDGSEVATKFAKVQGLLQIDGLENTINKVQQAGAASSASIPEVAEAVTKYGGTMRALGYSPDEILAMMENADKQSPNVEIAASRLESLGAQLRKKGLNKGTWIETINSLKARENAGENIADILGEARAVTGYQMFDEEREQQSFIKQAGLVGTSYDRNVLGETMREGMMKNPMYASQVYAQAARGKLEVEQEERYAELQALHREGIDSQKLYYERRGERFNSAAASALGGLSSAVGAERSGLWDAVQQEILAGNRGDSGMFSKDFEERLLGYMERTANGVEGNPKSSAE